MEDMDIIACEIETKIEVKDLTARFGDHRQKNNSEFVSPKNKQLKKYEDIFINYKGRKKDEDNS